jgi:hypothetical protein
MTAPWSVLLTWPARRWLVALATAAGSVLVVAIPTDLIDTPVFGREVPPTWWAWPSLLVSSLLAGLLVATYVRAPAQPDRLSSRRGGWAGGLLTYFAVGCPVCNKLVLLALGSAGAMTWFEPFQPVLQVAALVLLVWALRSRLRGELSCPVQPAPAPAPAP